MPNYLTAVQFQEFRKSSQKIFHGVLLCILAPFAAGVVASYIFDKAVFAGLGVVGVFVGVILFRVYIIGRIKCPACSHSITPTRYTTSCVHCGVLFVEAPKSFQ